jgi:hypothetical protein
MNGDARCGSKPGRWRCRVFFTKEWMRHDIPEEPARRDSTLVPPSASTGPLNYMDVSSPARKVHAQEMHEEEAVAALAGQVLSMTPTAKFFLFWHLGALHAGRCTQAATIPPATVVPVAARATPRRASLRKCLASWVFRCSCVCCNSVT